MNGCGGRKVETASVDCLLQSCSCEERESLDGRQRKMFCLRWGRIALSSSFFSGKVKGKKLLILYITKFAQVVNRNRQESTRIHIKESRVCEIPNFLVLWVHFYSLGLIYVWCFIPFLHSHISFNFFLNIGINEKAKAYLCIQGHFQVPALYSNIPMSSQFVSQARNAFFIGMILFFFS